MSRIYTSTMLAAAMPGMMYRDNQVGADGSGASATPEKEVPVPDGMRAEVFHFRREKVKDDSGNEIGEVYKHPSVKIPLPLVTKEEVAGIMTDDTKSAEQKFILDLIGDAYYGQARDQINAWREDNPKGTVSADIIDYSKLSITALANMPASERGSKVSDEDMAAFLADYVAIMPGASNKDANKIKAQANILEKGLRTVRTDKKVLGVMSDLLSLWAASTANLEEHQQVYEMLTNRIKKWVSAEPKNVIDSIL